MRDFTTSEYNQAASPAAALALSGEAAFFQKVYLFMGLGLVITAAVAFYVVIAQTSLINYILDSRLWLGLILAQLALVALFSFKAETASIPMAIAMLLVYAALNGVIFGVIVSRHSPLAVGQAFLAASLTFGVTSVYGLVTKKSLQKWGGFLYMAIWGLIFAMLINFMVAAIWKIQFSLVNLVISGVAVVIFSMLTAYRNQELRVMYASLQERGGDDTLIRLALAGALSLYLAFVGLFLHLLRIIGIFSQD